MTLNFKGIQAEIWAKAFFKEKKETWKKIVVYLYTKLSFVFCENILALMNLGGCMDHVSEIQQGV